MGEVVRGLPEIEDCDRSAIYMCMYIYEGKTFVAVGDGGIGSGE